MNRLFDRFRKTDPMRGRKVDFLIAGTQKGGTAALHFYLRKHPRIGMAVKKEVHFFDNDLYFRDEGAPDYDAYHAFFKPSPRHERIGEATPIYMYWSAASRRIRDYNPAMKIIVVLRNPIERAFSHWNMARSRGVEPLPFLEALKQEKERRRAALPEQDRLYSYVDRGLYREQIRRLWFYFSRQRVCILKSESLRTRTDHAMDEVCRFLGVEPCRRVKARNVHSRPYPMPMSKAERDYLRTVFEPEIRGLECLLGWDCSAWLSP